MNSHGVCRDADAASIRDGKVLPFANGGVADKRQFSDSQPAMGTKYVLAISKSFLSWKLLTYSNVCFRDGKVLPFANGGKTDKRQFSDSAPAMSQ